MPRRRIFFPNVEKASLRCEPAWRVTVANELFRSCIGPDGRLIRYQVSKWQEGEAVYRYFRYLKAQRFGYVQERRQAAMLQEFSDIESAREIENTASPIRLELRLRILAGESFERIAKKMQIDVRVVRTFWCYFFDVYEKRQSYLINLPRPGDVTVPSISPGIDRLIRNDHLEYFFSGLVDRCGAQIIDRLIDMYIHFGKRHNLNTTEGRSRECLELRFELYMVPKPTDLAEIGVRYMIPERLRQSSSYLEPACNLGIQRSVMSQLLKNTVPTPVQSEDFDFVEPRKSPSPRKARN